MHGLSTRAKEVAVVERWLLVEVQLYVSWKCCVHLARLLLKASAYISSYRQMPFFLGQ